MPRPPFVGPLPFAVEDAAYFFGRDRETELVGANLRSARLTILYGPSGVGKTSLLNAGVMSKLLREAEQNRRLRGKPGIVPVRFETWRDDPVAGLSKTIREAAGALCGALPPAVEAAGNDLLLLLRALTKSKVGDLLIILDQFEQFFLHQQSAQARSVFVETLAAVITDPEPGVDAKGGSIAANILISVREEWLPALDVWKGHIPGLFENYLRVRRLDYSAACAAIRMPVSRYNELFQKKITVEPLLVNAVLARCRKAPRQRLSPVTGSRAIRALRRWLGLSAPPALPTSAELEHEAFETPAIQLVMDRLWKEEIDGGSEALRLHTLERLSRDRDIVDEHVHRIMNSLGLRQRSAAAILIDRLVTPSGTKISQTFGDLRDFTRVRPERLDRILTHLCSPTARILSTVAPPPGVNELCYEVAHDTLAAALSRWQGEHAWRRRVLFVSLLAGAFALLSIGAVGFAVSAARQTDKAREALAALEDEKRHSAEVQRKLDGLTAGLRESPPAGRRVDSELKPPPPPASRTNLAVPGTNLWRPGSVIRIRFLGGSPGPVIRERIKKYANEWMQYANIRFEFGSDPESEIRIGRESGATGGYWSYLGTQVLHVPKRETTSNFEGFTDNTPESEVARVVRHEFGHVLGLIHELNQPNAAIPWDRPKVYDYFTRTQGWSKAEVDQLILTPVTSTNPPKPFDPKSIMAYAVPKELTTGGFEIGDNSVLSEGDKQYIAKLYPR